jgi:hypothetical protein
MFAFLHDSKRAAEMARDALFDIRARRARDRRSIWLLSREAWAHIVIHTASFELRDDPRINRDEWPLRYRENDCDPWQEFTSYDHDLERERDKAGSAGNESNESFSPGAFFRRRNALLSVRNVGLTSFHELSRVIDQAGFARLPSVNVVESRLEGGAALLGDTHEEIWSVLLTVTDYKKGLINQRFNRVAIARLDQELASEIAQRLREAVNYGRVRLRSHERSEDGDPRYSKWPDRVRILLELLSRVVVRLPPNDAIEYFRWSCELAQDPNWDHWWLFEPLDHLLNRLLDAIPPSRRGELATEILNFPLPGEKEMRGIDRYWPDISQRLNDKGVRIARVDPAWHGRITIVIGLARSTNTLARARALILLYVLYSHKVLTKPEQKAAADAIWSVPGDGNRLPAHVDLLPHIFLHLPEPTRDMAAQAFREEIVQPALNSQWPIHERSLAAATEAEHPVRLTEAEARSLASSLMAWRPREIDPANNHWRDQDLDRDTPFSIAGIMAVAVVPALAEADIDDTFVQQVLDSLDTIGPDMAEVLPSLVRRRPGLSDQAFSLLRRLLVSRSVELVYPGARAAFRWVKDAKAGGLELPAAMPMEIATLAASRREPALRPVLSIATQLVEMNRVSAQDIGRLIEALDVLDSETGYGTHEDSGLRADTLTLVRASCVRLASALAQAGCAAPAIDRWLALRSVDPMPEVRFALETSDD